MQSDQHKENQLRWRSENQDRYKKAKHEYYLKNKDKICELAKKFARDNPEWKASHCAKRRATKLKATPSLADLKKIEEFYHEAGRTGMVVDHIIPLKGAVVCGLHVETNLQLLTLSENSSKGNKFDPDTFCN